MTPEFHIDPELEGILREVARDPRAKLLRIARPLAFRAAVESSVAASQHATGLLSAERELLRSHRAELAFLLRQACVMRLFAHPEARKRTIRQLAPNMRVAPMEAATWRARARCQLGAIEADREAGGIELIERLAASNGDIDVDAKTLAAASMRLCPTDRARMHIGAQHMLDDEHESALTILGEVIRRDSPAWLMSSAWTNLGHVYERADRNQEALEAFRTACRLDQSWFMPPLNWFATAIVVGNVEHALVAARLVEECVHDYPVPIAEFVAMHRARASDPHQAVGVGRILSIIGTKLGPITEAIGRALV